MDLDGSSASSAATETGDTTYLQHGTLVGRRGSSNTIGTTNRIFLPVIVCPESLVQVADISRILLVSKPIKMITTQVIALLQFLYRFSFKI